MIYNKKKNIYRNFCKLWQNELSTHACKYNFPSKIKQYLSDIFWFEKDENHYSFVGRIKLSTTSLTINVKALGLIFSFSSVLIAMVYIFILLLIHNFHRRVSSVYQGDN